MNEERTKIVYMHLLNDTIVYIGSGGKRRLNSITNRSQEHISIWKSLQKIIYRDNLSVYEAKDIEQELITKYWDSGNLLNKCKTVNKTRPIIFSEVDKLFYYDESSPTFLRWKISPRKDYAIDDCAGSIKSNQSSKFTNRKYYYEVGVNWKGMSVHRIIYSLVNRVDLSPLLVIDHIDGVGTNNNANNLRAVTQSENIRNKVHKLPETNEYHISESKSRKKFTVSYTENQIMYKMYFSYAPKGKLSNPRSYRDRNLALLAAIKYRDELVIIGKIYKVKL